MREKVYSLLICAVFALLIVSCSTADDVTIYSPTVIAEPAVENKVEEPVVQAIAETEKVKEAEVAKVPEAEETSEPIVRNYVFMGSYLKVTIGNGVAYVEYPSIITKSDIDNAVAAAVSVYGAYLKDITYSVKDGVITVNFPKTYGEKELLFADKIISDELPAYEESLFGEIPVAVVEPAIETAKEEVKEELKEEVKAVAEKSAEPVSKSEPSKATTQAKAAEVAAQEELKNGLNNTVIIIVAAALVLFVLALSFFIKKKKKK